MSATKQESTTIETKMTYEDPGRALQDLSDRLIAIRDSL
jgi:hypothetical protein